ncbi:piezo-type mechanosensitive ion channel component 1-like isoform X2 [Tachypleus tridentatus]|uniref:piezo-type mechanosensitive ion channel component 1-like isoform X2 n=1 Tax=Tachypleus tridentatus TaxID=6853 RepID=UPI003FD17A3D
MQHGEFHSFLLSFRVVLPLVLLAAVIFRFNALSFIYLLLLLIAPVVPGPSPTSIISGHTGRYIKAVISLSCISCLAHVVFQAVLLSLGDYGKFPVQCTWEGRLFALFGLHRLDKIHPVDAMRLMGLDFLVLLSTVGVLVTCQKAFDTTPIPCEGDSESDQSREFPVRKRKKRTSEFLVFIGEVLFLVFLAGAGVLHPSLISSVYFLLFLFIATWLASGCKLGRIYILGRIALAVYTALYFIVLYLYQLDYAQELIQVDSLEARLLGLVGLVDSTCSINHDSRSIVYRPEDWTAYVQPLIVLALYWLVCFLTRYRLSEPVVQEFDRDSRHPVARSESSRSSQRSSASFLRRRRRNVQEGNQSDLQESMPLLDDDKNRKSYHSTDLKEGLAIDPNGSIILSTDGEAGDEGTEVTSVGIMKYRKYMFPLISFIGLVKKGSYVATLIIMMVMIKYFMISRFPFFDSLYYMSFTLFVFFL